MVTINVRKLFMLKFRQISVWATCGVMFRVCCGSFKSLFGLDLGLWSELMVEISVQVCLRIWIRVMTQVSLGLL